METIPVLSRFLIENWPLETEEVTIEIRITISFTFNYFSSDLKFQNFQEGSYFWKIKIEDLYHKINFK